MIYNHQELREDLRRCGHQFRTLSDTEVIAHLYEDDEVGWVDRLNGMFAVAIYDIRNNRVVLARDRYGIKPLFYSCKGRYLGFASELKALLCAPFVSSKLDYEALGIYLSLMFIPDPWTIFQDIRRLPPGNTLTFERGQMCLRRYWDFDFGHLADISRGDAAAQLPRLLSTAVARQIPTEVKGSLLLSGGIDSTMVAAVAARHCAGIPSFTISFKEREFDESPVSSRVSQMLALPNHSILFQETDLCQHYLDRQRHLDEPYALWCNVATARLAHAIRAAGIKVVLGGDAADELFLGYPTIHAALLSRWYRYVPEWTRNVLQRFSEHLPAGHGRLPLTFKLRSFLEADNADVVRNFFGFKDVLKRRRWGTLLSPQLNQKLKDVDPAAAFLQYRERTTGWSLVDSLSYLDLKVFMPGCVFYGIDNAFMEASVELRVPFLDNDLVDYVMRLPTRTRFDPLELKPIPKRSLRGFLPANQYAVVRETFTKRGFEVPGNSWLSTHGPFSQLVGSVLSPKRIASQELFEPAAVTRVLDEQRRGSTNHERLIQVMMSLTCFFNHQSGASSMATTESFAQE